MYSVLVPLAQGCEEIEAVTVIDVLRRAGIHVISAGLDDQPVKASRGTTLLPDTTLEDALTHEYDMVVLPGGLVGTDNLAKDERILELVRKMYAGGKYVCAICAAPIVLAKAGLLSGHRITSYPRALEMLYLEDVKNTGGKVEVDGKLITGRGPGTAIEFALQLVEALLGVEARDKVDMGLVRA